LTYVWYQSLFNVSGESYRKGGFKDRLPGMTNAQKLAALAADGKLIKRPLLVIETKGAEAAVLVGFKEEVWDATFAGLTL
jgi:arsenate reductase